MKSSNLGYPRIGEKREWKKALESFWNGEIDEKIFLDTMQSIRLNHIKKQREIGIDLVPVGDFTLYDHMLDTAAMFGFIPERFDYQGGEVPLSVYFAMARGNEKAPACEMTKWFNTNYHYIVPEWSKEQSSRLHITENKPLKDFREAKEKLGVEGKPVLIGPYTFMKLSKGYDEKQFSYFLSLLLPLYEQILKELEREGVKWIQIDEPILATSLTKKEMEEFVSVYERLPQAAPNLKMMLQTYFEAVDWYEELIKLPVSGIGLDFVYGLEKNLRHLSKSGFPEDKVLAAGVIDGRNIWRTDLSAASRLVEKILHSVPSERLWLQPSNSLLHVPVTTTYEKTLPLNLQQMLAFADEKLEELVYLTERFIDGEGKRAHYYAQNQQALHLWKKDASRYNANVHKECENLTKAQLERASSYLVRQKKQQEISQLPILPTTTIGSFPQTAEVRKARRKFKKGEWSQPQYERFIEAEIKRWIDIQEKIGLDVLVHGEFERTDMVEFFAEKLGGFAFTENGWVQSYGSRCVRPPIIYGDVEFLQPMTVKESVYAQSLTEKIVKGMLTGPVTILNWSFVRDDLPRHKVAEQIALALRNEIKALEESGISVIQVDEPALLEGLPLKEEKKQEYLEWAVRMFRVATSIVKDETQIHTHMCYCDFSSYLPVINQMDADVISIETSRSHGEMISVFEKETYPKGIGLGVYDIHSPRVPSVAEMAEMIERSLQVLNPEQFWVNPDCGLKTRKEQETVASLKNMVAAAKLVRARLLEEKKEWEEGKRYDAVKTSK